MSGSSVKQLRLWLVLCLSLSVISTIAQTKREVQFSLDTLMKSHQMLRSDYQDLVEDWKKYDEFYTQIKSAMLDKEHINMSIDSGLILLDKTELTHPKNGFSKA